MTFPHAIALLQASRPWWLALAMVALAACSPATPVPPPDELLAPKQLATVLLTPTPVGTPILPATSTPVPSATATPTPPPPTATRTPYVGVFMGDGSAPLVLPTAPIPAVVEITLQPPTPLPGLVNPAFPTATPFVSAAGGSCAVGPDAAFAAAYQNNPDASAALGCPVGAGEPSGMAAQTFERGTMIWRAAGEIYALSSQSVDGVSNRYWRVPDRWQEGDPPDDPSLTPPEGLQQPIRGFGLAWRSHPQIRDALGWGVQGEAGYTGTYQPFERGGMLTGPNGEVYALAREESTSAGPGAPAVEQGRYYGPLF